jgi:putative oxidoreductase
MQDEARRLRFLDTYHPQIFAMARIVFGSLFAMHGLRHTFQMFGGSPGEMPAAAGFVVGTIELVGGALVAVGYKTRLAAFLCSGQMAVAYFAVHQKTGLFPIQNNGELAAVYSWAFLMIASVRSWAWALESRTNARAAAPAVGS